MLYVFHVNLGHMLTFDMKLALETVNVLNDAIEQQYNIKGSHQVLLVSGGAVLRQSTRVCSYTAGTDTNPIFMFSRPEGQINIQPWPSIENNDTEIKEQIVHCFNLPATYETVVKRAELALQICEMAKDEFKICEKLVHEQHLQQQGWSAVMANMEDLTNEFQKRLDNFSNVFHEHLKRRDEYLEFLSHFNKDLHKLAKIPIFSNLLLDGPNAKEFNLKFTEYLGDVVETLTPVVVDDGGAAAADADAAVDADAVADADDGGSDGNVDSSTLTIRTVTSTTTTTTTTTTITAAAADGSTSNENIIKDIDKNSNNINNELETSQRIRSQSPSRSRESINNNDCTQIKSKEIELRNFQKIKGITLLEWISAKENQLTLEKLAENCVKGLHQIGDASVNTLKVNVTEAIRAASQQDVREIKGLDTRLSGLDRLMFEAKRIVQEQSELSTSFQHNQLRAGNLGDTSILPDLCASHSQQLRVMAKNHKTLRDIHRRISKAKHELAENLSTRLAYVVLLQNRMSELDNKMVFFHRCLRRLQRHLIIMEQIHSAPNIYATAITEVVRRRNFSSSFLMWASDLSNHLLNLHNEETIKRKEFSRLFDDHFLMVLFPGMRDLPPTYGTQAPTIFDADLPNLNENDIERLSTYLKYLDIPLAIEQPNMKSIQEFFHQITAANSSSSSSSNNNNNNNNDNKNNNSNKSNDNDNNNSNNNSIDNKNISQNDEKSCSMSADSAGDSKLNENSINIPRPLDLHAHLKDGFESETDTEEFEKVGQSPIERRQISSLVTASLQHQHQLLSVDNNNQLDSVENKPETRDISTSTETPITHDIETLTEENLGATKIELERVRKISNETLIYSNILLEMLRQQNDDIQKLKSFINDMRIDYERELTKLLVVIEQIRQRDVQMQRETINRLTVDHELEMNDIKKLMYSKDEEIHGLKLTTENLCDRIKELESMENNEMKLLREKVIALENEKLKFLSIKDKELNEQRDKLQRDHKTEVESLRSRFKLMTSRDRTPSETSLEKIERPDLLDLGGIESMSSIGGSGVITIDHRLSRHTGGGGGGGGLFGSPKSPSSGSTGAYDLYKKILEEKERQLDILRENEQRLVKENSQMKNNLQKVMNAEMASALDEDQHHHHHHQSINFESGVIAAAADAAAAATLLKEQMKVLAKEKEKLEIELCMQRSKKSEMDCSVAMIKGMEASPNRLKSMCAKPCVNIESCTKGDLVIVVWDSEHGQYKILQETPLLYFLHADSHPSLNLIPGTTSSSSSSSSSASAAAMLAISSSPNTNICATSIQVSTSPTNPIQSSALSSASLPKSLYCIGRVIEKEFCYARKDENRYKVTKGTKFYRVKVRPRSPVRGGGNESGPLKVRKGISFDAEKSSQITTAGDGSLSVPVSRSTSTNLLINSFAQTDLLDPVNEDNVFITSTSTTTATTTTTTTTIKTSQQTTDKSSLINKIKTSIQQIGNIDDSNFTNVTTATTHKSNKQNPITVAPPITSSPIVKQKQKFIDVDMIDSGVEAQQKIIYKERNSVSETDNNDKDEVDGGGGSGGGGGDGEPLSFTTFTQELTSSTAIAAATTTATATVTTTSNRTIEGAQQSSYYNQARHRYISVSEEDENILDNVSSSHCEIN